MESNEAPEVKTIKDITKDNMYTPKAVEILQSIVRAVIIRQFNYLNRADREDASSQGLLKCFDLLSKGQFDGKRSSIENYLYSGVRNEITNMLYKGRKEILQTEEEWYDVPSSHNIDTDTAVMNIDYLDLKAVVCRKVFRDRYLHIVPALIERLRKIGFIVTNVPHGTYEMKQEVDIVVLERFVCLVVWNARIR